MLTDHWAKTYSLNRYITENNLFINSPEPKLICENVQVPNKIPIKSIVHYALCSGICHIVIERRAIWDVE